MKLEDLKPDPNNPRKQSDRAAAGLKKSLEEFGDIGGLTWNKRTGEMVGGHQRVKQLIALGAEIKDNALVYGEHSWPIRVVDWPKKKQRAANVAANNASIEGDWTADIAESLKGILDDYGQGYFEELRFDDLGKSLKLDLDVNPDDFGPGGEDEQGELDKKAKVECPHCGYEFEA